MTPRSSPPHVVVLDNRDSFVQTVARYLRELGARTTVLRSDRTTLEEVERQRPSHVVISPGPCTPAEAGVSTDAVRALAPRVPLLGICLGHLCIAVAFGGTVVPARQPTHGRSSPIRHRGAGILEGLSDPFQAARYHSLAVERDTLPPCLRVEAETADEEVMAIRHEALPVWGVQFHPESVLTSVGRGVLGRFIQLGAASPVTPSSERGER